MFLASSLPLGFAGTIPGTGVSVKKNVNRSTRQIRCDLWLFGTVAGPALRGSLRLPAGTGGSPLVARRDASRPGILFRPAYLPGLCRLAASRGGCDHGLIVPPSQILRKNPEVLVRFGCVFSTHCVQIPDTGKRVRRWRRGIALTMPGRMCGAIEDRRPGPAVAHRAYRLRDRSGKRMPCQRQRPPARGVDERLHARSNAASSHRHVQKGGNGRGVVRVDPGRRLALPRLHRHHARTRRPGRDQGDGRQMRCMKRVPPAIP